MCKYFIRLMYNVIWLWFQYFKINSPLQMNCSPTLNKVDHTLIGTTRLNRIVLYHSRSSVVKYQLVSSSVKFEIISNEDLMFTPVLTFVLYVYFRLMLMARDVCLTQCYSLQVFLAVLIKYQPKHLAYTLHVHPQICCYDYQGWECLCTNG